jgi:Chlorophyll A-B binding protein
MLAAAGWPISELFDKKIAALLGMAPLLQSADRAPSVLNGGLGNVSPVYWGVCLVAAAAIDLYGIFGASKKDGYTPGDFGFDPLGVFPKEKEGQEWFKLAEIKNGRLAMIAITAFAVQVRRKSAAVLSFRKLVSEVRSLCRLTLILPSRCLHSNTKFNRNW